jgi:GNAT superfamily N-acetyltransferase
MKRTLLPVENREWRLGEYTVSNDPARLQLDVIHGFLARSYWAMDIPRDVVARSIEGSLAYGVYRAGEQVGFARIITDYTTFAYVADVFVLEEHRSRGLARWLMRCILETPELQGLRRWLLVTRDAHKIYADVGFAAPQKPENIMEKTVPNAYTSGPAVNH